MSTECMNCSAGLEKWLFQRGGHQWRMDGSLAFPPRLFLSMELPEKKHHFLNTFFSTGTYPLDVVRRRMQMKGATGELFKYNSTWHAFNVIAKTEGIHGLFKGMWPNLLKASIT